MSEVTCQYCNLPAELIGGSVLWPKRTDLAHKKLWVCKRCDSRVGCHPDTQKPLGTLANHELRIARMQAHSVFDPIWKQNHMPRSDAYEWLAMELGIPVDRCHIAMFDVETCKRVVDVCLK